MQFSPSAIFIPATEKENSVPGLRGEGREENLNDARRSDFTLKICPLAAAEKGDTFDCQLFRRRFQQPTVNSQNRPYEHLEGNSKGVT